MNKTVKGTLVLTMAVGMGLSATGCSLFGEKASKLIPETKGSYGFSITQFTALDGSKNYTVTQSSDGFAVFRTADGVEGYTYKLVNLQTGETLKTSTNEIKCIDKGLYYSTNEETDKITLYKGAETIVYDKDDTYVDDNVFYNVTDNTRTYVNVNGKITTVSNPFEKVLCYGDNYIEVGEKYVKAIDNYYGLADDDESFDITAQIFDEDGKYEKTISLVTELGIASDEEAIGYPWVIDNTLFVQTQRQVPDSEKTYDYTEDGEKYVLTTYAYNVEKDKVKTLKNFDYIVEEAYAITDDMAIAYLNKVEDEKICAATIVQTINKKGKVAVDLQDLVPNATDFEAEGEYVYIEDINEDVHVFKKNKKIATVTDAYSVMNGYAYQRDSSSGTLQRYDLNDDYAYFKASHVTNFTTLNEKMIYVVNDTELEEKYIVTFDTLTGNTTKRTLDITQSVNLSSMYATITNENGTKDLYLPASNEIKTGYDVIRQVETFYERGKSSVLLYTEVNGNGTYYMLTRTYPVAE